MNSNMVVITYNLNDRATVIPCLSYEQAISLIRQMYTEETEDNEDICVEDTFIKPHGEFAQISFGYETMQFRIGEDS